MNPKENNLKIEAIEEYESAENFINRTAYVLSRSMAVKRGGSNFDEVYDNYFKEKVNSKMTSAKVLEYIKDQRQKVKEAVLPKDEHYS